MRNVMKFLGLGGVHFGGVPLPPSENGATVQILIFDRTHQKEHWKN